MKHKAVELSQKVEMLGDVELRKFGQPLCYCRQSVVIGKEIATEYMKPKEYGSLPPEFELSP